MTELDLSVDGELSSSFEPCLNKINIHINFINVGIDFVNHPCYIFHSSRWSTLAPTDAFPRKDEDPN